MPSSIARTTSPTSSICSDVSEISLDVLTLPKNDLKLSINDFKLALDLERTRSQQKSRCEAVKTAQSQILKIYAKARKARNGPTDSMSLPSYSRPQTRTENHDLEIQRRAKSAVSMPPSATAITDFESIPPLPRKPTSKVCIRVQSSLGQYQDDKVTSICRQCCEVLGPKACHECGKIQRRIKDMQRFQKVYPGFLDPDEDVVSGIVMKKYLPLMDIDHIQNLVAQGQISNPSFRDTLSRLKEESLRKEMEAEEQKNAIQNSAPREKDTYTFFSSIRDLNQKIVSGRVNKNITVGRSGVISPFTKRGQSKKDDGEKKMTFTEALCPMFISPKRLKSEPPGFIATYSPPLLPRASQNVEPAFFAGNETPYKLPDRLPEKPIDSDESV